MESNDTTRRRVRALDGRSFRCEQRNDLLSVSGMPARVHALSDGIVALETAHTTVQVSGSTYWELLYGNVVPNFHEDTHSTLATTLPGNVGCRRDRFAHPACCPTDTATGEWRRNRPARPQASLL